MSKFPDMDAVGADFRRYQELVPEYALPMSKRAQAELQSLMFDEDGKDLPEREAARNIRMFQERVRAKIVQLEPNLIWHGKLHEVREGNQKITVGSSDAEFEAAPRTDLKAFQEILTAGTERMAFRRGEKFVTARTIIIDPANISNTLLENLGLTEFIPPKGTKREAQLAYRAKAIPPIKEMLEGLEAFTLSHELERSKLRYFRLFRVNGGENGGKVLGTQVIGDQKILFLTDLHGAHRRIGHIFKGYDEEISVLQAIQSTVRDVDVSISTEWQKTKDPQRIQEVKDQLKGLVDKLRFVTNAHKKKMKEQIEAAVTMETVYTRPARRKPTLGGVMKVVRPAKTIVALNPGATRARINTSHLHVGKRIEEITAIKQYLIEDETRVQTYIEGQSRPFTEFYETVNRLHEQLKVYRVDRPLTEKERSKVITNLRSLERRCSFASTPIMMFEPYQTFGAVMVGYIARTTQALEKGEDPVARQEAAEAFTKIYLVTKIQRFYSELQALYTEFFSGNKTPDFDALIQKISTMDLMLSKKTIAPQVATGDFNKVFGELYHLVNSIRSRARKAKTSQVESNDTKAIRQYVKEMHDRIKSFDFVELMGRIGRTPVPTPPGPQAPRESETTVSEPVSPEVVSRVAAGNVRKALAADQDQAQTTDAAEEQEKEAG